MRSNASRVESSMTSNRSGNKSMSSRFGVPREIASSSTNQRTGHELVSRVRESDTGIKMKRNPFPWLPFWPKVEDRGIPVWLAALIILGIVVAFVWVCSRA
jgi:hypothetical protein